MVGVLLYLTLPVIEKTDFTAFYTGGQMVMHGVRADFYHVVTQEVWERKFFPNLPQNKFFAFLNPPFVAYAYAPLALFPIPIAYICAGIINFFIFSLKKM